MLQNARFFSVSALLRENQLKAVGRCGGGRGGDGNQKNVPINKSFTCLGFHLSK